MIGAIYIHMSRCLWGKFCAPQMPGPTSTGCAPEGGLGAQLVSPQHQLFTLHPPNDISFLVQQTTEKVTLELFAKLVDADRRSHLKILLLSTGIRDTGPTTV